MYRCPFGKICKTVSVVYIKVFQNQLVENDFSDNSDGIGEKQSLDETKLGEQYKNYREHFYLLQRHSRPKYKRNYTLNKITQQHTTTKAK